MSGSRYTVTRVLANAAPFASWNAAAAGLADLTEFWIRPNENGYQRLELRMIGGAVFVALVTVAGQTFFLAQGKSLETRSADDAS